MTAEAEKVITMSLTKMAESRGIRRGGTSLHKHLLISSVLTKARSAYFETWFTVDSSGSEIPISSRPSAAPKLISSEPIKEEDKVNLLEPSSLFQLDGTEMDLPRDILNCVEKMGGMPSDVGFNLRATVRDEDDESEEERRSRAELILADFVGELDDSVDSPSKSFTYLDLDGSSADVMVNSLTADIVATNNKHPNSSTLKSKRRRDWNFDVEEEDDEDLDEDSVDAPFLSQTKRFRFSISENYTFRSTCESKENTIPLGTSMLMSISTNYNSSGNRTPLEPFFTFKGSNFNFRTKKAQFEEQEEETEDSPFFFDDEDCDSYEPIVEKPKNDRRVPSSNGSSSNSSSDEEHEQESTAMEVDLDKITNLVQYISFSKGSGGGNGMVRSISTPDLFSRPGKNTELSDNTTTSSSTQATAKDLYSLNSHAHHHRVLTMKV